MTEFKKQWIEFQKADRLHREQAELISALVATARIPGESQG